MCVVTRYNQIVYFREHPKRSFKKGHVVTNSYKETMNLPETDFPMRGNLPKNEPARLQFWNDIDIYHKVLEKNKDCLLYTSDAADE